MSDMCARCARWTTRAWCAKCALGGGGELRACAHGNAVSARGRGSGCLFCLSHYVRRCIVRVVVADGHSLRSARKTCHPQAGADRLFDRASTEVVQSEVRRRLPAC